MVALCVPFDDGVLKVPVPAPAPAPAPAASAPPLPSPWCFGGFSPPFSALPATSSEEAGFFGDGVVGEWQARCAKLPGDDTPLATAVALPTTAKWIDVGVGQHEEPTGGWGLPASSCLWVESKGLPLAERGCERNPLVSIAGGLRLDLLAESGKCRSQGANKLDIHSPIASSQLSSRSWAQSACQVPSSPAPSCLCGAQSRRPPAPFLLPIYAPLCASHSLLCNLDAAVEGRFLLRGLCRSFPTPRRNPHA